MSSETIDKQIIPYSHHYRCFPQMIGSPVHQSVFMYLLDEYNYRLRVGGNTLFFVTANEISQKRNIDRRTVVKCIVSLQTMGLIEINENICKINVDVFVSLIVAFSKLTKTNDKLFFIDRLQNGDYSSLSSVGYEKLPDGNTSLLSLKNSIQKSDIYKNVQPCTNMLTTVQKCIDKNAQPYAKMHTLEQKCYDIFAEIRSEVRGNMDKIDFIDEFRGYFMEFCSEEEFGQLVLCIFDDSYQNHGVFTPEFAIFLHVWGCTKMHIGMYKNAHGYVQKCTTVNNKIIENKNSPEHDINDDEFYSDIDIKSLDHSLLDYQSSKLKNKFPFFPAKEIEEYISDIRNCVDGVDKLFINQVWEILHECYDQDATLDESGKEILPANNNLDNVIVDESRLFCDILLPAYNQVKDIVDAGVVEYRGDIITVTATLDDNPSIFDNIIDWEKSSLSDGTYYTVSTSRIRNVFSSPVDDVPNRSTTKKDRADDMTYMQKVVLMGDDDGLYKQLTPVELVMYNFLNEYFVIDDFGNVTDIKSKFITRTSLAVFYIDAKDKGVTEADFIQILSKDKPEQTGCLNLRQRMFSADKIRRWNKMHSVDSVVDITDVSSIEHRQ